MSDLMIPIPFDRLMNQILREMKDHNTVFGVKNIRKETGEPSLEFAGEKLENPLGVAAGPHTQLAQNIVACYAGGARFIETKTVQKMFGEELGIPRPCIRAVDEGYNVEWSSEYSPQMAAEEYIKAWFAVHAMAIEFGLGNPQGFQFNMSVGYNLEGIKSPSVDAFLNILTDASSSPCFQECKQWLLDNIYEFKHVQSSDIDAIPSKVCNTCTLSTMHGCPAEEIEKIASYLLEDKGIATMIKMNPTLLGYEYCRGMLDSLGYHYIQLDPHSFEVDLQFHDAIPMVNRLIQKALNKGVFFGVKLSNTMAVKICNDELPGEQMYMSGKALYPLTISLAHKISEAFHGKLTVSYSGGADQRNIHEIYSAGIFPVTVCTILLQGQGYDHLEKLALQLEKIPSQREGNLSTLQLDSMVNALVEKKENHKSEAAIQKQEKTQGHALKRQQEKVSCRVLCQSCVRVCPNRANTVLDTANGKRILHLDFACNECGNCQFGCPEPCTPYRDRLTYFDSAKSFHHSENNGFFQQGASYGFRWMGQEGVGQKKELPDEIRQAIEAQEEQQPWLKR